MKTRRSKNTMEGDKSKQKLSRTEIMRRYKAKLKDKPDKLEAAREKDRERKRLKTAEQMCEILGRNRNLHEKVKSQNSKNMAAYRAKLK